MESVGDNRASWATSLGNFMFKRKNALLKYVFRSTRIVGRAPLIFHSFGHRIRSYLRWDEWNFETLPAC